MRNTARLFVARLIACSCDYLPGSTQPSSPALRRHPAVRALGGRGMVLVRVRLVLGPLGPVPREATTLT